MGLESFISENRKKKFHSVFSIFWARKVSFLNILVLKSYRLKISIPQNMRVASSRNIRKTIFWENIINFFRVNFFFFFFFCNFFLFFKIGKFPPKNFLSLGLESSILHNRRKTFFAEKIGNFFRVDFSFHFSSFGWKVRQVAPKSTTQIG